MSLALIFFNANAWANSEQEVVTIIGTQEDLQSLSGSGAIITSDDLDMFEFLMLVKLWHWCLVYILNQKMLMA